MAKQVKYEAESTEVVLQRHSKELSARTNTNTTLMALFSVQPRFIQQLIFDLLLELHYPERWWGVIRLMAINGYDGCTTENVVWQKTKVPLQDADFHYN